MTRTLGIGLLLLGLAWTAPAGEGGTAAAADTGTVPRVEVVFALDTTGSMGGLIEGAKQKIWTIANNIVRDYPKAELRFGLLAYRDRGDQYVTRKTNLTGDLDAVFIQLRGLAADGGGDTPESVNQALHEAVNDFDWTRRDQVYRVIFLVGDAPPHMDYPDDVKYPVTCEAAARAGIVVNTVQCGNIEGTAEVWRDIARRAEGQYAALAQDGNMVAVATPMDAEIAKVSAEISATVLPYGSAKQQALVLRKVSAAAPAAGSGAGAEMAASRASVVAADATAGVMVPAPAAYAAFTGESGAKGEAKALMASKRAITGDGDLVADLATGKTSLKELKADELPPEFKALTEAQRQAEIDRRLRQRAELNTRLADLSRQREDFLSKKAPAESDSFDANVSRMINTQAAEKIKR